MKSNKTQNFWWQTKTEFSQKNQNNDKFVEFDKEKSYIKKLFSFSWIEKFNVDSFLKDFYFLDKYDKWSMLLKSLDYIISLQKHSFEIINKKIYLDTLFSEEYINNMSAFAELKLSFKHEEESLNLSKEMETAKNDILTAYKSWENYKKISLLFKNILNISYDESYEICKKEKYIIFKLNAKTNELHKKIFSIQNKWLDYQELEKTWQIKLYKYEKDLRDEKPEINIIIIDDLERIRYKMMKILSNQLDKYIVNFREMDSFEEAKDTIQMTTLKNYYLILDNNFYEKKYYLHTRSIEPNMWVKLFDFISKYRESIIDNIIICSSDDNIDEKFPKSVDIIKWKSLTNLDYINEIAYIIKWKLNKTKNPE